MSADSSNFSVDAHLLSWEDIRDKYKWSGILLGNGFSRAVWDNFRYSSLYDKASSSKDVQHPLTNEDKALFKSLKTENFERVLFELSTARLVNKVLKQDYSVIERRYENIKTALGEAVKQVHPSWNKVNSATKSPTVLHKIREDLKNYKFVYSTNYDLLIYWAVMSKNNGSEFKDYFWYGAFNITNTNIYDDSTRILYLHGALHLYRGHAGKTLKRKNWQSRSLLDSFEAPLFITEGSAEDKLESIRSSDYLSFAYTQFSNHKAPLVIFGHSLGDGDADKHLVEAIRKYQATTIAISVRRSHSPETIAARKVELHKKICEGKPNNSKSKLIFFDAQTHPLGSPDLKVEE